MTILDTSSDTGRRSNFDGAGLFGVEPLVGSVQPAKRITAETARRGPEPAGKSHQRAALSQQIGIKLGGGSPESSKWHWREYPRNQ
jgi:hypothetical protein